MDLSNNQLKNHQEQKPSIGNMAMSFHTNIPMMVVMQADNEFKVSSYTKQSMPTVKILRRPIQQNSVTSRNIAVRPNKPFKTLQQREQEYAEARLRILGSAKNPEDDLVTFSNGAIEFPEASTPLPNVGQPPTNIKHSNKHAEVVISGAVERGSNFVVPSSSFMIIGTNLRHKENILRMPRGPDGTNGFHLLR